MIQIFLKRFFEFVVAFFSSFKPSHPCPDGQTKKMAAGKSQLSARELKIEKIKDSLKTIPGCHQWVLPFSFK